MLNDEQLGDRLRRAFEREVPPSTSADQIREQRTAGRPDQGIRTGTEPRLTRRAIADLGLDLDACRGRSARNLVSLHSMIGQFVGLVDQDRGGPLDEGEVVPPLGPPGLYILRAGRRRGLVWDDEDVGVTWLLAVTRHRLGDQEFSSALSSRDELNRLLPTVEDYEDLEPSDDELRGFVTWAIDAGQELISSARAEMGSAVSGGFGELLTVTVTAHARTGAHERSEDVHISFEINPSGAGHWLLASPEWLTVALAAILPDAQPDELVIDSDFPRLMVRWAPAKGLHSNVMEEGLAETKTIIVPERVHKEVEEAARLLGYTPAELLRLAWDSYRRSPEFAGDLGFCQSAFTSGNVISITGLLQERSLERARRQAQAGR